MESSNFTWKFVKSPEHWFELVVFAHTTGLLSILPFAFYVCCVRYTASEIMGAARLADEKTIFLPIQDQLACLAGYRAICKAQAETTFSWAYTEKSTEGCTSTRCTHIRAQYLNLYFTSAPIIGGLSNFSKPDRRQSGLRAVCVDQAEEMHNAGRKEFWRLLPSLFGLPPWEELCKERELYVLLSLI